MAVTAYWYPNAILTAMGNNSAVGLGRWNWTTTTQVTTAPSGQTLRQGLSKVALYTSTYTPLSGNAYLTQKWRSDITSGEVSASLTNYTTRGATLGSPTAVTSSKTTTLDAADTTWTTATFTAAYAVIYSDTATDSDSPLIALVDFGGSQSVAGGDFQIVWNASGIAQVTVS